MEGNKYLKAKQFKIFLQKRKTLIELERKFEEESGIPICGGSGCSVHISGKKNFDKIANAFKIDPVEQFNGGMSYPYESAIYIDGVRIFTIYNKSDINGI